MTRIWSIAVEPCRRGAVPTGIVRLLKSRRAFRFHTVLMAALFMASCIPTTPSQYIQPDDMEDILVDYHLARALAHNSGVHYDSIPFYQALCIEAVFRKHGITQEQFDSSMVYYYTRADRFEAVYKRVAARLEERALILGATEGEIGKYASLNANGDTASIWPLRTRMLMTPIPPYNRWDFRLEADSTFRRGDSFLLQFVSDFIYQEGAKEGIAYMAATYGRKDGRDTTISRNTHFLSSGISQINYPAYDDGELKELRGYFYLGDGNDRTTTTRLLFLSNVQLIRFHNKQAENEKDSLSQDSISGGRRVAAGADTISVGDSLGNSGKVVHVDSGAAAD